MIVGEIKIKISAVDSYIRLQVERKERMKSKSTRKSEFRQLFQICKFGEEGRKYEVTEQVKITMHVVTLSIQIKGKTEL